MVKASLSKFMGKYPYFLNRDASSVFHRTSDVNNRSIQRLYNDLYDVYYSFHLDKNVWIWKEQERDYEYTIHFATNFPNLRYINIYKNDVLIKKVEYLEEGVNHFDFDYHATYVKNNTNQLNVYQCTECGTIYLDDTLPVDCTTENCDSNTYYHTRIYQCSECGEIYFITKTDETVNTTDCSKNNHLNTLEEIYAFRCRTCGEIYLGKQPPYQCSKCETIDYSNEGQFHIIAIPKNDDLQAEETITVDILKDDTVIDTVELSRYNNYKAYTKTLNLRDENNEEIEYTLSYASNFYTVLIDSYVRYQLNSLDYTSPTLYLDDSIDFIDNSEHYNVEEIVEVAEPLTYDDIVGGGDENEINVVTYEGNTDTNEDFLIEIPRIPLDNFKIEIETWDEYKTEKGFPENDYTLLEYKRGLKEETITPSIYDHDYSLDEIGALNNIPRKIYNYISDPTSYPYTEPPYTDRTTEDDYHYMKRMIEYNERIYYMNPVSLELWKMYGIDSTLINRERYLIKVFDEQEHPFNEETGLVECWSPKAWEHKDRFCDGSTNNGEYFFVTANTVRPVVGESITCYFNILDGLAQPIDEEYDVDIYKVITQSDKNEDIETVQNGGVAKYSKYEIGSEEIGKVLLASNFKEDKVRISHSLLSKAEDDTGYATNVFYFVCKKKNGEIIGDKGTYINVQVRDYNDADIFVDPNSTSTIEDGSDTNPYKTLEKALEKVDRGSNLIGLADNITIDNPLIVDTSCIILGKNIIENDIIKTPIINQLGTELVNESILYNSRFFKITGNKNCMLTLANISLQSGNKKSNINFNTWLNNNKHSANYESVIIHSGGVILTCQLTYENDDHKYYPFDFITGTGRLTNTDGETVANQQIKLYYNGAVVKTYTTGNDGTFTFKFHLDETQQKNYTISIHNVSEDYFGTQRTITIDATKPYTSEAPYYINENESVNLVSGNHEGTGQVKFYASDGTLLTTKSISNGEASYYGYLPPIGRHIIYTTIDNNKESRVRDEWLIETKMSITQFANNLITRYGEATLIKDLVFNKDTNDIRYSVVQLDSSSTLEDLEGVVINVEFDSEDNMVVDYFEPPFVRMTSNDIIYSDMLKLQEAFYEVKYENGILKGSKVGEMW